MVKGHDPDLESSDSEDSKHRRNRLGRGAAIFMVLPERTLPAVICACVLVGALVAVVSTGMYGTGGAGGSRPILSTARALASSHQSQLQPLTADPIAVPLSGGNGTLYTTAGLHLLPSFAKAQQISVRHGMHITLEPTPFNPPIHDFVDYKADTEFGIPRNTTHYSSQSLGNSISGVVSKMAETFGSGKSFKPKYGPLTRSDIMIALPSQIDRMPLVEATRKWRKGVRTYVAFEQPVHSEMSIAKAVMDGIANHNETYGDFRDLINIDPLRNKAGDVRAALTPFMANNSLGADSYKWILYGDDDTVSFLDAGLGLLEHAFNWLPYILHTTVFFVDNALKFLEHLDPNMPYFISDHIWFPQRRVAGDWYVNIHPNRRAPRCLPCDYVDPLMAHLPDETWFNAPMACPCTHAAVCKADTYDLMDKKCRFKHNPVGSWNFIHGGAGAIISVGLMKKLAYQEVENAMVSRHWFASGDSMISEIMSDQFDVLPTDPGYGYFRPHIRLFDPGWRGPQVRGPEDENTADFGNDPIGVIERLETALQSWCNDECEDQLQHVISTHLRSRYASSDVKVDLVQADMPDYTGPKHHEAAVYLHSRLAELIQAYSDRHPHRQWFTELSRRDSRRSLE